MAGPSAADARGSRSLPKLVAVAGPLIGLGAFLYGALGRHSVGLSLIVSGVLVAILYLGSLINASSRAAFSQVISVVGNLVGGATNAYKGLPNNFARLVFGLLLVCGLVYLASIFGGIGWLYVSEEERSAVAHLNTADSCLERDDYLCAKSEVENARKLLPQDIRVYETEIRGRVLKLAQDEVFFHSASTEDVERASIDCEFLLQRNPTFSTLIAVRGIIYSLLDDPHAADQQFSKAAGARPSYANTHNYWGFDIMHWQIEDRWPDRAREEFEKAASLNPKYVMPLINLAWLTLETEKPYGFASQKAEGYLLRAKDASPDDQRVLIVLGDLYLSWGQWLEKTNANEEATKKYKLSADELVKAYAINPNNPFLLEEMGELLIVQKTNPERVIQRFKDAVVQRPEDIEVRHKLGHAYEQAGKMEDARIAFTASLEVAKKIASRLDERVMRASRDDVSQRLGNWLTEEQELVAHLEDDVNRVRITTDTHPSSPSH